MSIDMWSFLFTSIQFLIRKIYNTGNVFTRCIDIGISKRYSCHSRILFYHLFNNCEKVIIQLFDILCMTCKKHRIFISADPETLPISAIDPAHDF